LKIRVLTPAGLDSPKSSHCDGGLRCIANRRSGGYGTAFLRVGLSVIMLLTYAWNVPVLEQLFGPFAQLSYNNYLYSTPATPLALYRYSSNPMYIVVLYGLSMAISGAYALGVMPRIMCWLFALTTFSMQNRIWYGVDAGQSLVVLLSFLLCLVDTSVKFTLFHRQVSSTRNVCRALTVLHNGGRFLISWQICMVYFWSTFYKLQGTEWRHGTAMHYVWQLEPFMPFATLSHFLSNSSVAVTLATSGTVLLQASFVILMWNRRTKPWVIGAVILLHLGIAVLMNLFLFSLTVIVADLSLLSDAQFSAVGRMLGPRLRTRQRKLKNPDLV